jgi:hypothetical protein
MRFAHGLHARRQCSACDAQAMLESCAATLSAHRAAQNSGGAILGILRAAFCIENADLRRIWA